MSFTIEKIEGRNKVQHRVYSKSEVDLMLQGIFSASERRANAIITNSNRLNEITNNINESVTEAFTEAGFYYNDQINEVTDALNNSIQNGGNEFSFNEVSVTEANGLVITGYDRSTNPDTPISRITLRGDGTTEDGISIAGIYIQKNEGTEATPDWITKFWASDEGDLFMNGNLQLADGSVLVGTRNDPVVFISQEASFEGITVTGSTSRTIIGEGSDDESTTFAGISIQALEGGDWVSNFYANADGDVFLRGEINAVSGFLGTLQVDGLLSSSDYVAGSDGWAIDGDTGNAEFNKLKVRVQNVTEDVESIIEDGLIIINSINTDDSIRFGRTGLFGDALSLVFADKAFSTTPNLILQKTGITHNTTNGVLFDINSGSEDVIIGISGISTVDLNGTVRVNGSPIGSGGGLWTESGTDIYYDSGNVGIGLTNPVTALHVSGFATITGGGSFGGTVVVGDATDPTHAMNRVTSDGRYVQIGSETVSSVFGRTGDVVAQSGDYDSFYVPSTGGRFTGDVEIYRNNVLRFHAVGNSDTASIDVTKAGSGSDQALAARIQFSNSGSWNRKNIDFIVGDHQNYTTPASDLALRIHSNGTSTFYKTTNMSFLSILRSAGSNLMRIGLSGDRFWTASHHNSSFGYSNVVRWRLGGSGSGGAWCWTRFDDHVIFGFDENGNTKQEGNASANDFILT